MATNVENRTAEDLTATSRRLARYEALLNDIMPHVPSSVKAMIEDAREQVPNTSHTATVLILTQISGRSCVDVWRVRDPGKQRHSTQYSRSGRRHGSRFDVSGVFTTASANYRSASSAASPTSLSSTLRTRSYRSRESLYASTKLPSLTRGASRSKAAINHPSWDAN